MNAYMAVPEQNLTAQARDGQLLSSSVLSSRFYFG